MGRSRDFLKSILIYGFGIIVPRLSHLFLVPIYTSFFSPSEYGVFDVYIIYTSIFVPIASLEIQQATFRYLINKNMLKEKQRRIISTSVLGIIPTVVIFSFCVYLPSLKICSDHRPLLGVSFVLATIVEMFKMIARGLKCTKEYTISSIIQAITTIVLMFLVLGRFNLGLKGALIANILVYIVALLYLFFSLSIVKYISIRLFDLKTLRVLLAYSLPVIPTAISSWILTLSDRVILTNLVDSSANGLYAIANKIPQIVGLGVTVFNLAWQESAVLASKDSDSRDYYTSMYKIMLKIVSGICVIIIAFTPVLFKLLVKGDYGNAYIHTLILLPAYYFNCCAVYFDGIYISAYETKKACIGFFVAAVINISIDLAFVKNIEIYAASLSTLVSYIFLYVFRCFDMRRHKIQISFITNILLLIPIVIMSLASIINSVYLSVILGIVAILYFVFLNKKYCRYLISKIFRRNSL